MIFENKMRNKAAVITLKCFFYYDKIVIKQNQLKTIIF